MLVKNLRKVPMTTDQLNALWDDMEAKLLDSPDDQAWGRQSEFLMLAYGAKLITWDQAVDMYECAIGMAECDDPILR